MIPSRFALILLTFVALSACGGNKPKPNRVFLMPAPGIYEEGQIDPFVDNDPISKGVQPGVLYATDRAVAKEADKKYDYYTHERGSVLRLGEAYTRLGVDEGIAWEEARKITLLKNRTENYPLLVASELWHFLGYNGAFIAYSWPTKFSIWAYVADLENAIREYEASLEAGEGEKDEQSQ